MVRKAIRMQLLDGFEEEYQKRHQALWPEMSTMLRAHGVTSYYIYLDPETNILFGFLEIVDEARWAEVATTEINRKWWAYMADLMETNPDDSPVTVDLLEVFDLSSDSF